MGFALDLTGIRFGKLIAIERAPDVRDTNGRLPVRWVCLCDCGETASYRTAVLRRKVKPARSCGCLQDKGKTSNPVYHIWNGMKARCLNPNSVQFPRYGGRGISVCPQWQNDFLKFAADMGPRPAGHSIDRINNDGHYEPKNCRWATLEQQGANTRASRFANFRGKARQAREIASLVGCDTGSALRWIRNGDDIEARAQKFLKRKPVSWKAKHL